MDKSAKECLDTAANQLQQATGCQPSVAAEIVELISLGTIRRIAELQQEAEEQARRQRGSMETMSLEEFQRRSRTTERGETPDSSDDVR